MNIKNGNLKLMFNRAIKYCFENNIEATMSNLRLYMIKYEGLKV